MLEDQILALELVETAKCINYERYFADMIVVAPPFITHNGERHLLDSVLYCARIACIAEKCEEEYSKIVDFIERSALE